MTTSTDQRQFHRILFDAHAVLSCGRRAWTGRLVDLSLKGALLQDAGAPPAVDSTGELRIRLGGELEIVMAVRVRHVTDGRIGLACEHIDLDSIAHLRRLVELNTAEPGLLNRELAALGGG